MTAINRSALPYIPLLVSPQQRKPPERRIPFLLTVSVGLIHRLPDRCALLHRQRSGRFTDGLSTSLLAALHLG